MTRSECLPTGASGGVIRTFDRHSTAAEVLDGVGIEGRVFVITGCTAGIGFATMAALNDRRAFVYGLCRRLADGYAVRDRLRYPDLVTPVECDLADVRSVEACASVIAGTTGTIDALICNAGVYFLPRLSVIGGIEKQFVVNHLGHFLLVDRLLPQIDRAAQGRVVIVGSEIHKEAGPLNFEGFTGSGRYHPVATYAQSKLANVTFGIELARRRLGGTTTVNVASPMWVMTETMRRHLGRSRHDRDTAAIKSPEQGAATLCYVATAPELDLVTGRYFENCNVSPPSPAALDAYAGKALWDLSVELIGNLRDSQLV